MFVSANRASPTCYPSELWLCTTRTPSPLLCTSPVWSCPPRPAHRWASPFDHPSSPTDVHHLTSPHDTCRQGQGTIICIAMEAGSIGKTPWGSRPGCPYRRCPRVSYGVSLGGDILATTQGPLWHWHRGDVTLERYRKWPADWLRLRYVQALRGASRSFSQRLQKRVLQGAGDCHCTAENVCAGKLGATADDNAGRHDFKRDTR